MKGNSIKIFIMRLLVFICFALWTPASIAQLSGVRQEKLIEAGAPEIVMKLLELSEKQMTSSETFAVDPSIKKSCDDWMREVFSENRLPEESLESRFFGECIDGRDVVRYKWKIERDDVDAYQTIEVYQTRSIFVINIPMVRPKPDVELFERPLNEKTIDVFCDLLSSDRKDKLTEMGRRRPNDVSAVAAWLTMKHTNVLTDNNGDEIYTWNLRSPQIKKRTSDISSVIYTMDWFEVLGCWNDGDRVVIYFEKPKRSGLQIWFRADFSSKYDQGWF